METIMAKLDRRGKTKVSPSMISTGEERVLMTFQVDESLREAANRKAKQTSINLSQFLRQCVHEFTYSEEVGKALKEIQRNVAQKALASEIE